MLLPKAARPIRPTPAATAKIVERLSMRFLLLFYVPDTQHFTYSFSLFFVNFYEIAIWNQFVGKRYENYTLPHHKTRSISSAPAASIARRSTPIDMPLLFGMPYSRAAIKSSSTG